MGIQQVRLVAIEDIGVVTDGEQDNLWVIGVGGVSGGNALQGVGAVGILGNEGSVLVLDDPCGLPGALRLSAYRAE